MGDGYVKSGGRYDNEGGREGERERESRDGIVGVLQIHRRGA